MGFQPQFILFLVISSEVSSKGTRDNDNGTQRSPRITNWGKWGKLDSCPSGLLVTGFQLKLKPKTPGPNTDNTALDGVRFSCGVPHYPDYQEVHQISSANENFGNATRKLFCSGNGYVTGIQLKSQKPQGDQDDVAAINLKIICENGDEIEGYDEKGDYYKDSEYSSAVKCDEKMAVCGLETQVEPRKQFGDNTSLNNVNIQCCSVPKIYLTNSITTESLVQMPSTQSSSDDNKTPVESEDVTTDTPGVELPVTVDIDIEQPTDVELLDLLKQLVVFLRPFPDLFSLYTGI